MGTIYMIQTTDKEQTEIEVPAECWLCNSQDATVYRGLATLGIDYSGPTRFICDSCIEKVRKA